MSRKLSKKEEGELVTKGFLYNDFMGEIDNKFDKKLEAQTKMILEETDKRISVQTGAIMEEMRDYMKSMMEAMNMRFEMQDRRFERMEKKHDDTMDWLQNHEKRISKLEYKGV